LVTEKWALAIPQPLGLDLEKETQSGERNQGSLLCPDSGMMCPENTVLDSGLGATRVAACSLGRVIVSGVLAAVRPKAKS
jgi:hypothetical protein